MLRWRTLRRGLVIVLAGGLVLYLAFLLYSRVRLRRAEAAFLKTFGTLDLASFERRDPPRSENAAEWLQAGAQVVFLDDKTRTLVGVAASRTEPDWSDEERESLRRALDDNRCALDLMHRAASAPQTSYCIRYSEGTSAAIPRWVTLRTAGHLLAVEARMAVQRGDGSAAVTAFRTLARLSVSLEDEPIPTTLLMGFACEYPLLRVLAEVAARPNGAVNEAELVRAGREALPANDLSVQVRRAFAHSGLATSKAFADWPGASRRWGSNDDRLLEFIAVLSSDLVRAELLDSVAALASVLDALATSGGAPGDERPAHASYLPHVRLAEMMGPHVSRMRDAARDTLGRRHLVRTALALRALGAAGTYPGTLPLELQRPDPLTGKPLAYTLHPDGSATLALQLDAVARTPRSPSTIVLPPPTRLETRR